MQASGTTLGSNTRRWHVTLLVACAVLLIAVDTVSTALLVFNFRERALADSKREISNTARALAENSERALQSIELVQASVIERIRSLDIKTREAFDRRLSAKDVHEMLADKISGLPQLEALTLVNADGVLLNYSRKWPIPLIDVADRDYFKALRANKDSMSILGEPAQIRGSRKWTFHLARKVTDSDGEFLGVILGAIQQSYFEDLFSSIALGNGAAISLFRSDGTLLARVPHSDAAMDPASKDFQARRQLFSRLHELGTETATTLDGDEQLATVVGLAHYPLAVSVSALKSMAIAQWREQARFLVVAAIVAAVAIAAMFFLIARAWLPRQRQTQILLQERERQLETAFSNMSQGMSMFDAAARVVVCNRRYIEMFGLSLNVVQPGRSLLELVQHRIDVGSLTGNAEKICRDIMENIALGKPSTTLIETPDGRCIRTFTNPISGGGWVATHEDITEQRKVELDAATARANAERAERDAVAAHTRLRDALEVVPEGIALFDADDRYVLWNSRYTEMYPNDGHIAVGMRFEDFLRERTRLGRIAEARGREEAWIAERLARRAQPSHSEEQQLAGNQWVQIEERRTADGGTISVRLDITELKRREASFRLLFDSNPLPMWLFERETLRFLAVNDAAIQHYGYSREQFLAMTLLDIRPAEDKDELRQIVRTSTGLNAIERTWRHKKADGTVIDVSIFSRPLLYEGRSATIVAAIDVTVRKRSEEELRSTREFLNMIVENVPATIVVKDARDLKYLLINQAGERLYGASRDAFIGKTAHDVYPKDLAETIDSYDRQLLNSPFEPLIAEHPMITRDRGERIINSKRLPVLGENGEPRYLLTVSQDVTESIEARKRIDYMAHHDVLTELPNRAAFMEKIQAMLAPDAGQEPFAAVSIDLDNFKDANDVFGHATGDMVLVEVARRLKEAAGTEFLARVGGDEFVIIVSGGKQPATAEALAERLLDAAAAEFKIRGQALRIGLSIGVAIYPTDGPDLPTLLGNADAALYRAKADGRGTVRFFDSEMDKRLRERRSLQHDLQSAIALGQITLHYQPQTKINGEVIGFEALARWTHPARGTVPPGIFIPLAEESGAIFALGEWILREGCREAASWPNKLRVGINLSPIQFRHGDLVGQVHSVLLETGLSPGRLELEITEGVLVDDFAKAIAILRQLKALGVRVAMDDFGTGYSSLSYLQSFPFDKIKVDRAFISDIDHNLQSVAIVRAIISLARGLELPVLAEGVETADQLKVLSREGCQEVQGYFFGRPRPIDEYGEFVGRTGKLPGTKIRQSLAS